MTAESKQATPLPIKPLLVLCSILLNESLSITFMFPMLPFMIKNFGFSESEIGYRVGLIPSGFLLAQFFSSFIFGRLSDRVGRRPILLFGIAANVILTAAFGFTQSLAAAVIIRTVCGLLNSNIGVAKAYLADITDETNQAKAFSAISMLWGMGMLLGPLIGGSLSLPLEKYPDYIPDGPISEFLTTFPFILPCLVVSSISLFGFILGVFHLKEPNKKSIQKIEMKSLSASDSLAEEGDEEEGEDGSKGMLSTAEKGEIGAVKPPAKERVFNRNVILTILMYCILKQTAIIADETFPIWARQKVEDGGLGLDTAQISYPISAAGIFLALFQIFGYHRLDKRLGTPNTFRFGVFVCSPFLFLLPFLRVFYVSGPPALFWAAITTCYIFRAFTISAAFTATTILISNSAPRAHTGDVNGVSQSASSLAGAIAPIAGSSIFAFSSNTGLPFPFDYHFIFVCCALEMVLLGALSCLLTKAIHQRRA